ncbi:MAG: DEAD/DEAH box helicase [Candidatus Nanopelagicales bacterium]
MTAARDPQRVGEGLGEIVENLLDDRRATDLSAESPSSLLELTLAALSSDPVTVVELPPRPGITADWPAWVDPRVRDALGIDRPWRHQVEAAEAAWAGRHVVLSTPTASGKSVAYWLPTLTEALAGGTTLYCTPTKALAADQQSRLAAMDLPDIAAACYDGDTDRELRPWIRRRSRYVLTNTDMLHRSMLPRHPQWRRFLARLRFVVIDEGHLYRGVFGANVAAVITRLRRLCATAGADPVFLVCSATLGNPAGSAARLVGVPYDSVIAVADDSAARAGRTVILHDPAQVDDTSGEPVSAFADTARALTAWVRADVRSVGFLRSRSGVEAMAQTVRSGVGGGDSVTAYRGGLLPEERRDIERRLRSGDVRCVASTNALELGVDIAGLDAVAMCGWPGTRLSFLQQLGRAGRRDRPAVALLSAQADPLDRFYVHHPDRIFDAPLEAAVFDRENPFVLLGHVACAVAEQPLTTADARTMFGATAEDLLSVLAGRGLIRLRGDTWFWVASDAAHTYADLRSSGGVVTVIEADTGRVMGTMDGGSARSQLHPGAVYVHLGVTHVIESLSDDIAVARRDRPGYTTTAQSVSSLRVLAEREHRVLPGGTLHFGDVDVTGQVVGFLKRAVGTGRVLGSEPLAMPPTTLRTTSVWWCLPDPGDIPADRLPGAAHAAEHAAIGVLPAIATCDRWDIGGLSTARHPDTGQLTVFVYDGHAGGAGFARRGFDAITDWLSATWQVITSCDCATGCPGCVQSPKCGNGNEPLDKDAGAALLRTLLSG